ncbi:hypothetical protein TSUD_219640 [Trifolium subterraneum]|uniref:Uncharacterized protein n=1 Tax=Trifolium subterraneum TaxID=3900 RepID=A0A2Z6N5S8_TRISU|nr:hypothetical protein TSUD_219640 [Trifolium subterraneum]
MNRATLLWYILPGREVDIARVIANEIRSVTESGIKKEAKPVLPYPGLITGLCEAEHVHIPALVSHQIKPINDKYIKRYCKLKEVQQQPQAPQLPTAPLHPVEPQQAYPDIDPRLQNLMQLYQGVPVNPDYQVMSPQHFQTHIAWPGDRPQFAGGAGASNVGGDNDDSIDEATADAMDDEEDATQTREASAAASSIESSLSPPTLLAPAPPATVACPQAKQYVSKSVEEPSPDNQGSQEHADIAASYTLIPAKQSKLYDWMYFDPRYDKTSFGALDQCQDRLVEVRQDVMELQVAEGLVVVVVAVARLLSACSIS